jgi:phage host-nuclease inhibitor protein Gam
LHDNHAFAAREHAEHTIQAANEEVAKIQAHYENETAQIKRERVDLVHRVQDLSQQNERLKIESARQTNHYRAKYTEYKQKLRKANQNIATLLSRVAKYDIQLQAEKREEEGYGVPLGEEHNW